MYENVYFNGLHRGCIHITKIGFDYYTWGLGGNGGISGGPLNVAGWANSADIAQWYRPTGSNAVNGSYDYAGGYAEEPNRWFCNSVGQVIVQKTTYDVVAYKAGEPDAFTAETTYQMTG